MHMRTDRYVIRLASSKTLIGMLQNENVRNPAMHPKKSRVHRREGRRRLEHAQLAFILAYRVRCEAGVPTADKEELSVGGG